MAKFQEQVEQIEAIGRRLGIDLSSPRWFEELADAAGINRESMRKYVGGYQPMPQDKLAALRLVEENRRLQMGNAPSADIPPHIIEAYSMMPQEAVVRSLAHVAGQISSADPQSALRFLLHIRAMAEVLEKRFKGAPPKTSRGDNPAFRPLNSISEDEAAASVAAAELALELERKASSPSPGAGGPSGHKPATSQSTLPGSKGKTPPPGRAPK